MRRLLAATAAILAGSTLLAWAAQGEAAAPPKAAPAASPPRATDLGRPIRPLGLLPDVPVPPDNKITPAKVELGKLLFFDARTSGDVSTSCAACHLPQLGWGDGGDLSRGYPGTQHWRNSQTILNSAYYRKLFWAGESTSLEGQADSALTGNLAGNVEPDTLEERLAQAPEYVRRFKQVFGTSRPQYPDVLKAIAAFERAVPVSRDTPFDRYVRGDRKALSAGSLRGMRLYQTKARCIQCHDGPLMSDEDYHALGLPENEQFQEDPLRQIALRYQFYSRGVHDARDYRTAGTDLGLYFQTLRPADTGKFRTPSLRELVHTAPYMHNGVFFSLEEVVDFYDAGGGPGRGKSPLLKPLRLTAAEKQDLIAFLKDLSGKPILVTPPPLPEYKVAR